ncbi:EthD family reductase [Chloroflexota bacterium]
MATYPLINSVATECQPEAEEKFNKWYNEVHIPLLLKFKGIKKVTRYKIVEKSEEHPTYLAIYEFESRQAYEKYLKSPELAAAREEMKETWKDGGFEVKWRVPYDTMKSWGE